MSLKAKKPGGSKTGRKVSSDILVCRTETNTIRVAKLRKEGLPEPVEKGEKEKLMASAKKVARAKAPGVVSYKYPFRSISQVNISCGSYRDLRSERRL